MTKQINFIIALLLMTFSIAAQNITATNIANVKQIGNYDWTVFIQADDVALNTIDHVEYLLNPSFSKPQVGNNNRAAKFNYSSTSPAEFEIKVKVIFRDASKTPVYLTYWLRLR